MFYAVDENLPRWKKLFYRHRDSYVDVIVPNASSAEDALVEQGFGELVREPWKAASVDSAFRALWRMTFTGKWTVICGAAWTIWAFTEEIDAVAFQLNR